nr:TolC family protein [Vibrio taketomensis]
MTQSIYSFSNWAYFAQAKDEVKRVAAELENVRQELIIRVAEAYFDVLKKRDTYLVLMRGKFITKAL